LESHASAPHAATSWGLMIEKSVPESSLYLKYEMNFMSCILYPILETNTI
jgi:hypothetical protein